MELIKNLRYMCRICAVNIKKRRSSSSAVSIETPQLTEKLKKYLNMDVNHNDVLPKSICSMCFKKIEAIHALAALAKKTENFLTDFIKIAQNNLKQAQSEAYPTGFQNEFNMLDNDCIDDVICCDDDHQQNANEQSEEVVLNFTLNDPLTKNIHKKIVVAKQKKQNQLNQQREKKFHDDIASHFGIATTSSNSQHSRKSSTDTVDIIKELQVFSKRTEQNTSLEQKRQNLKMILNNTTNVAQNSQRSSPESSKNYKVIIPNSSGTSSNINVQPTAHSINAAAPIQSHLSSPSTAVFPQPTNESQQQLLQSAIVTNLRTSQMINDCLNLGSVIKDMDLLKLILKALKWPFNQDTLNTQIQRLKCTRFRDVMVDPNLLLDTDLMQILSSYLSPILLQTSPPQANAMSTSSIPPNILPPSVSYKIPAETSVRLVCVPREETQQQQQQQRDITSSMSYKKSTRSDYKSDHHKSKKHSKNSDIKYHRQMMMQNYGAPSVIVVSDEESCCSDKVQRFEVNVDPMLYFNGADSSYENSNESTMVTMGYFKQQQQNISKNSEITYQKRKKQKRKQTLQNSNDKNSRDQDILIIDENGEKPINLNNKICVPAINLPSTSITPTTSAPNNFEFTTPKKRRKLNTLKSISDTGFQSKDKYISAESMVNISNSDILKSLAREIKTEKNLDDYPDVISKYSEKSKHLSEDMTPNINFEQQNLATKLLHTNVHAEVEESATENKKSVIKSTGNVKKLESEKSIISQSRKTEVIVHAKNKRNDGVEESINNLYKDDTNDDDDSNNELVIDEGYDDEKTKEDDSKMEKTITEKLVENLKPETKCETSENKVSSSSDKSPDDSKEQRSLRRSGRQTKSKEPIKSNKKDLISKNLVDKRKVVSTRGQTRQQEQTSKMQTRYSNVSQRGRKQKPFSKYTKKK